MAPWFELLMLAIASVPTGQTPARSPATGSASGSRRLTADDQNRTKQRAEQVHPVIRRDGSEEVIAGRIAGRCDL
jgi:hypothetical protein